MCSRCLGAQAFQDYKCKKVYEFCHFRQYKLLHYDKRVLNTQNSAFNSIASLSQENHEDNIPYDQSECSSQEPSASYEEPLFNKVYRQGSDSSSSILSPTTANSHASIASHMRELSSNSSILLAPEILRMFSDRVIKIFSIALIDPYSQTSFILGSLSQKLTFTNVKAPN